MGGMSDPDILPSADLESLRDLPRLSPADRAVLERLIIMAPETAVATASAILRTHQGDLHDLFFPPDRRRRGRTGRLAAALVYLALAMSAPAQGKFMPILTQEHFQRARYAGDRLMALRQETGALELNDIIADEELAGLMETFIGRWSARRPHLDPRWIRAMVTTRAGAFYQIMGRVSSDQFRPSGDVEAAVQQLARAARTRDLLIEALTPEEEEKPFDPAKRQERIERLQEFGWREFATTPGRWLQEIAAAAAAAGLTSDTQFALSDEWAAHGAGRPATGARYFMRAALLPDSEGLSLSAHEERLRPLQRVLAGEPSETGLRVKLGTVELFLEYLMQMEDRSFLVDRWTRTENQYDGMYTRLGLLSPDRYAITLFPASRRNEAVGVWPVIEVEEHD